MVLCVTVLVYWAFGFALMYGDGPTWIGVQGFFPSLLGDTAAAFPSLRGKPVPLIVAFAFSLSFADTPATLVAGSGAERLKLLGFMILTVLISGVVFPIVGRAVWGNGILARMSVPFYDNGSATIQLCGGLCALVSCWRLGPREGRFNPDGTPNKLPSSSMPLVFLGTFILWMGFIGFNMGAAMTVKSSIGLVIVNTVLGGMAGATVALVSVWTFRGKGSLRATLIGMLTASVAVTSISPIVEPWAAVLTGAVAGVLTPLSISIVARLQLDDPTEYVTMNVFGGILGTLAVGVFSSPDVARRFGSTPVPRAGLWYGEMAQFASQLVGLAAICAFVLPVILIAVLILQRLDLFRVSLDEERIGSDRYSHGEAAYEGFAWAREDEGPEPPSEDEEDEEAGDNGTDAKRERTK
jgi:Amt family ammonium transporter